MGRGWKVFCAAALVSVAPTVFAPLETFLRGDKGGPSRENCSGLLKKFAARILVGCAVSWSFEGELCVGAAFVGMVAQKRAVVPSSELLRAVTDLSIFVSGQLTNWVADTDASSIRSFRIGSTESTLKITSLNRSSFVSFAWDESTRSFGSDMLPSLLGFLFTIEN